MAKVKIGNLRPPLATVDAVGIIKPDGTTTVSYTHLDVYKRQFKSCLVP